ncbi:hypothetical protein C3B44_09375 [Corynebacterium yudongzhengii]|nr:hypothetical protein [Corynebacterium yudongzhengii]AWB82534.1 hypothetical protein C3B44_09375 [Corynebacterium yudongzhengii]
MSTATTPSRPTGYTRAMWAFGLRAATAALLAAGLLSVMGTREPLVGTIAAVVMMVAVILSGIVLTWFASAWRMYTLPRAGWVTAQGAVVLISALLAPVVFFPAPLATGHMVVWYLAAAMIISGGLESAGRVVEHYSLVAGISQVAVGVVLLIASAVLSGDHIMEMIGPVGVVMVVHAVVLGALACRVHGQHSD